MNNINNDKKNISLAGFSKTDITPEVGIELEAYHRASASDGILDNLYAATMVLKDNNTTTVLINVDNVGITISFNNEIRKSIEDQYQIDKENIMICYSHTHSGPKTVGKDEIILNYCSFLKQQIIESVGDALNNLRPCKVGWGVINADVGLNRREHIDGVAVMGTNPDGVVDKRVGILKVEEQDTNKLLGVIVRVTAHANVLKADNLKISGDFPSHTRMKLEDKLNCTALVTIGAAGNVNAKWRGTIDDLDKMSSTLCEFTINELSNIETNPIYKLTAKNFNITTETVELPKDDAALNLANEVSNRWGVDTNRWLKEVNDLTNRGLSYQTVSFDLQFLTINDGILCGVPMEAFSEYAIIMSTILDNNKVFFGGYTNGIFGYLPSEEEFYYGGYEVEWNPVAYGIYFGRLMPLDLNTEKLIIDTSVSYLDK